MVVNKKNEIVVIIDSINYSSYRHWMPWGDICVYKQDDLYYYHLRRYGDRAYYSPRPINSPMEMEQLPMVNAITSGQADILKRNGDYIVEGAVPAPFVPDNKDDDDYDWDAASITDFYRGSRYPTD